MSEEVKKAPTIQMSGVESTRIAAAGYDMASRTLAIKFVGNPEKVYHYHNVPIDVNVALETAESPGAFFASRIQGFYPYDRVEADGTISKSWAPQAEQDEKSAA